MSSLVNNRSPTKKVVKKNLLNGIIMYKNLRGG